MSKKENLTHYTCTSTPLDKTEGSRTEHISVKVLNRLHETQTGTPISDNPAVAIIQREKAIMRDKRNRKGE